MAGIFERELRTWHCLRARTPRLVSKSLFTHPAPLPPNNIRKVLEVDTAKGTWLAPARPGLRHQHRQALHGRLLTSQPANQNPYGMTAPARCSSLTRQRAPRACSARTAAPAPTSTTQLSTRQPAGRSTPCRPRLARCSRLTRQREPRACSTTRTTAPSTGLALTCFAYFFASKSG